MPEWLSKLLSNPLTWTAILGVLAGLIYWKGKVDAKLGSLDADGLRRKNRNGIWCGAVGKRRGSASTDATIKQLENAGMDTRQAESVVAATSREVQTPKTPGSRTTLGSEESHA